MQCQELVRNLTEGKHRGISFYNNNQSPLLGFFYNRFLMDIARIHSLFMNCKSVSIDTRKILNSFFCCFKRRSFDANTFAAEALGSVLCYN
jgi:hypothetical protein